MFEDADKNVEKFCCHHPWLASMISTILIVFLGGLIVVSGMIAFWLAQNYPGVLTIVVIVMGLTFFFKFCVFAE